MANILLINPSYRASYSGAKASIVTPIFPTLGLATIGATARERGHNVRILDLSWRNYDVDLIRDTVRDYAPDVVGLTGTTPLMNQIRDISVLIKDISRDIAVVAGGPHVSALPVESMHESMLDGIFAGEADYSFADFCDSGDARKVPGMYLRDGDNIAFTGRRTPIDNLNDLPMPAWDLYDVRDYSRISRLLARRRPLTMAEFSRGCVFKCDFCASKITMALGYRKKSPERCAEEVRQMHRLGFREFMLADDIFTSDQKWAVEVCEAIARTGVDMAWTCTNGIRVESADERLFTAMRKAGCYRVSFGFESGNDDVLKKFGKGGHASIEQGRAAVRAAQSAGMETNGFFMMGLSPDTEETMQDTIAFARTIPVDVMKFGISIAFPGTPMFNDYMKKGLVRSFDWDEYFIYTDRNLFAHEHLTYETIRKYMKIAYEKCILYNPGFILRRLLHGLKNGEFFWDLYYGIKFFLLPSVSEKVEFRYHARERWPVWDFGHKVLEPVTYQIVRKKKSAA